MSALQKYKAAFIQRVDASLVDLVPVSHVYLAQDADTRFAADKARIDQLEDALREIAQENAELKIQNDAMHGAMGQQIERLQRAVEWCLENGAWIDGSTRLPVDWSGGEIEVPAEFAAIIKPAREE